MFKFGDLVKSDEFDDAEDCMVIGYQSTDGDILVQLLSEDRELGWDAGGGPKYFGRYPEIMNKMFMLPDLKNFWWVSPNDLSRRD